MTGSRPQEGGSNPLNQSRSPGPTKLRAFARPHVRLFTRSSRWYDGGMDTSSLKNIDDYKFPSWAACNEAWERGIEAVQKAREIRAAALGHDLEMVTVTGRGDPVRGWFVGFGDEGVNLRLFADDGTPGEAVTVLYTEPPSNRHEHLHCGLRNTWRRGLRVTWYDAAESAIYRELMAGGK